MPIADNRIDTALAGQPPGLWPFIPAGYPDVTTTTALLQRLAGLPIRGVELGFPFSDPIADGPIIQQAFTQALAANVKVDDIFNAVAEARKTADYPILAMVSASIVYRIGVGDFLTRAAAAGFDGLIIPDLSLEEAGHVAGQITDAGLRLAMLVAPTTPPARRQRIAAAASGFLYYVSVQGVTGERGRLAEDLETQVRGLRETAGMPVLVGFGISTADHVRRTCTFADGAIVGSAIVHRMIDLARGGATGQALVEGAAAFISSLAGE